MAKKKLLWLGDCVIPSGFGRVSESILTRIHKKFDVYVMGINYWGQPHQFPFKIYSASKIGGAQDPYGFSYIKDIFEEVKPDIIVAFNDLWIIHRYWHLLKDYKKNNNFKFVAYFPVDGGGFFKPVVEWLNEIDLAITYTDFGKNVIRDAGYTGRMEILEHGIDAGTFFPVDKNLARETIGKISPDDFIVFNGNRNQPRKRIDFTIMGFAKFAVDKPDTKLYLHMGIKDCGWDIIPLFNQQMESVGLDPKDRLLISGLEMTPEKNNITPETLNIIYNCCDVGINTSEGEGWGLVPFEHAACGVPQVVTNYSAGAELFKSCGSLINISCMGKDVNYGIDRAYVSIDSIVEELNKLYYDRNLLKEKGSKCLAMTKKSKYQWNNVAKKLTGFLNSI